MARIDPVKNTDSEKKRSSFKFETITLFPVFRAACGRPHIGAFGNSRTGSQSELSLALAKASVSVADADISNNARHA
jgi:hypothetical protein